MYHAAVMGNPAARVKLAKLPATEMRLAEMVYKAYGGKVAKPKKSKAEKLLKKSAKKARNGPAVPSKRSMLEDLAYNDPSPAVRQAALHVLGL